jgi:hypothetical protein
MNEPAAAPLRFRLSHERPADKGQADWIADEGRADWVSEFEEWPVPEGRRPHMLILITRGRLYLKGSLYSFTEEPAPATD